MRVAFYWLTMGPYHLARMEAIAKHPAVTLLTVYEAAPVDDHRWSIHKNSDFFTYVPLTNGVLSRKTEWAAYQRLRTELKSAQVGHDIFVNAAGYSNLFLNSFLSSQPFQLFLWSESTALDNPDTWSRRFIKHRAIRHYRWALTAGTPHSSYLKKIGFTGKDTIVRNVVPLEINTQIHGKEKVVLFVGRFIREKRGDLLIEAFKALQVEFREWKLVMVGSGNQDGNWKKAAGELNGKGILFTGRLFGTELSSWYQKASIFVLPSDSEPWGLVTNEAMQNNCACVVSSACGTVPDLINPGVTGFVFERGSVKSLEIELRKLMENESYRLEIADAGFDHVAHFSPEVYAERCVNAFSESMKSL